MFVLLLQPVSKHKKIKDIHRNMAESEIEYLIKKGKHHRNLRRNFFSYIFPVEEPSTSQPADLPPEAGYASISHDAEPTRHTTLQLYDNDDQASGEDSMIEHPDPNDQASLEGSLVPQVLERFDPNALDTQDPNAFLTWPRHRPRTSPRKSSLPARLSTEFAESSSLHSQELTYSSNRLVISNRSDTDDEHVEYSEYLRTLLDNEKKMKLLQVMCYASAFAAAVIFICFIAAIVFGKPPEDGPVLPEERS